MNHTTHAARTASRGAILALSSLASLALPGCDRQPKQPPVELPASGAAVVISGARLVLPAVPGRPAALYFAVANTGTTPTELTGVTVAGATSAEMHETVGSEMKPLPTLKLVAGQVINFDPGNKHVMVFGLPATAKAGDSIELTLTFADGTHFSANARAETPGGSDVGSGAQDMPGMTMGHGEPDHAAMGHDN